MTVFAERVRQLRPVYLPPDPATWPDAQHTTSTDTTRYGTAAAHSWNRLHPRLTRRAAWLDHGSEVTTAAQQRAEAEPRGQ